MIGGLSAELFKLYKRPATWVISAIFALCIVLFGYLFSYLFVASVPEEAALPPEAMDAIVAGLLPERFLVSTLSGFANFGSALALILGAMLVGGEYGWDTFKLTLTQRPGRLGVFGGKLLALGVTLAVITVVMLFVGAASSYTVAVLEGENASWPGVVEVLGGFGAGWLILAVFASFGVFLATLFRGTALAIGLGLVYLLVLESIFIGLSTQSETAASVGQSLPAINAGDLAGSFGETPAAFGNPVAEAVEPSRAVLVLFLYGAVFLILAALVFRRRDVA